MAAKVGAVNYFLSPLVNNLRTFDDYVLTNPQISDFNLSVNAYKLIRLSVFFSDD